MGQGVDQNCPLGSGPWVTLPLLPAPFKLACAWMLSLKQTWRTTLCLHTILWYDQRATTPLHLGLLQRIKINLENSPALHPHNASSSLLTRFFTNPHTHQERQLTTPAFSVAVVSLQPGVVGSWLLEQAGFRYINVFQHWVIQSYFLLLHQSVCVYWVSPIKYLSNKVTLKYKMPWFDLTGFWEYPQKGQVRSEASWLFPTIYYCLLLYLTSSSSTGLIQTNQTENDNVFCLY